MKKIAIVLFALFLLLLFYLLLYPTGMNPANWTVPANKGYTNSFAKNEQLKELRLMYKDQCDGCEDVAIKDGVVYGGDINGNIIRMDDIKSVTIANTGGRPLGLDFDLAGNLIIADAVKGLLSYNFETKKITTLTNQYNGQTFGFTDDVEVGNNGIIYFSDASKKFGIHQYKLDLYEHQPNGAFYSYDPTTKETKLLLDKMYFANGIAIDSLSQFALINETGKYRVTKCWLDGPKKGQREVLIENLPGFPDGISSGSKGVFWLTLISPRNKDLDEIMDKPFIRKILARLPEAIQPAPQKYLCIIGINKEGEVIYNFQDPKPEFYAIASVQEYENKLYFGSLVANGYGVFDLDL